MGNIILNNQSYSFESIRVHGAGLLGEADAVHNPSFTLARQWLRGDSEFVFFTSGSTGVPKKNVLHREQLMASAQSTIDTLGLVSDEHILVCMNTQFIGGAMLLIRGLLLDATITLQEPSGNPLQFIEKNHPYTFVSFAPVQLFPLLQNVFSEKEKLDRFRFILVGGAPIDKALEQRLALLSATVYHTYGMTETVSHIALKQIGKDSFYTLLKGVSIQTDERNCLAIQSPSTQNRWIQTNDVVNLLNDTSFELLGRYDDMINSGGIKIWPAKIEQAIRDVLADYITQVLVIGIPDIKLGQKGIAIMESQKDIDFLQQLLESQLPGLLDKYEIPKQFYVLPGLAYTPTGKPNKAETLKMIRL
jgi:O-succinylbenzoic acid--CoA ligase